MASPRFIVSGLAPLVAAVVVVAGLVGCTTNPVTGRSHLSAFDESWEIQLGMEASPEFVRQNGGEVPDPQLVNYVRQIGLRLARQSERPDLPWEIHLVNTPVINAFALPGGKVFMTRGLLSKMTNEAQLAGVLGHEVAHVTAQHVNERVSQALGVQVLAAGIGVAGAATDEDWLSILGAGTQVAGTGYLLKFGRDQESEADELGVRYMANLGYNPWGQVQVMKILAAESGGGAPPEFLSTHPLPQTRIDRLSRLISQKYPSARGNTENQYGYFAERFRERALDRLKKLPPPPPPSQAQIDAINGAARVAHAGHCSTCAGGHGH